MLNANQATHVANEAEIEAHNLDERKGAAETSGFSGDFFNQRRGFETNIFGDGFDSLFKR